MRRLNPNLERRLFWIGVLGVLWCLCVWGVDLFKIADPENEYPRVRKSLEVVFLVSLAFVKILSVLGAGLLNLVWFINSVTKRGLSSTLFLDPSLAKRSKIEGREKPTWLAFFMRAAVFLGSSIAVFALSELPCGHSRDSSLRFLCSLAVAPLLVTVPLLLVSGSRYYTRREKYLFGLVDTQLYPYDPAILLTIKAPKLRLTRERNTQAWWNLMVLAYSRYEADGTFPDGTAFSIKLAHRMPWFRSSRLAAVLRIYVEKSRAVATVSAENATMFPAEAVANLGPVLSQAHAFLLPQGSSLLVVTTHYVQASLLRISSVTRAFEAVELARQIQVNLQVSRDGGYRGDSPLSATPAEIAQVEAIAEDAWTSFPSKPRGSQP